MSGFDKGTGLKHEKAHARPNDLNPQTNGPFLDDLREEEAKASFEARNKKSVKPKKKSS